MQRKLQTTDLLTPADNFDGAIAVTAGAGKIDVLGMPSALASSTSGRLYITRLDLVCVGAGATGSLVLYDGPGGGANILMKIPVATPTVRDRITVEFVPPLSAAPNSTITLESPAGTGNWSVTAQGFGV